MDSASWLTVRLPSQTQPSPQTAAPVTAGEGRGEAQPPHAAAPLPPTAVPAVPALPSHCPRTDLFDDVTQPGLAENRDRVLQLPRFASFDHVFEKLRSKDERHSHLKSQALILNKDNRVYGNRNLMEIMQAPEEPFGEQHVINEEKIAQLVERAARSSQIPKSIARQNAILKDKKEARLRERLLAAQQQQQQQMQQRHRKHHHKHLSGAKLDAGGISRTTSVVSAASSRLHHGASTPHPSTRPSSALGRGRGGMHRH